MSIRWNDDPWRASYDGDAQPGDTVVYLGQELRIAAMVGRRVWILMPFENVRHEPFSRKINIDKTASLS